MSLLFRPQRWRSTPTSYQDVQSGTLPDRKRCPRVGDNKNNADGESSSLGRRPVPPETHPLGRSTLTRPPTPVEEKGRGYLRYERGRSGVLTRHPLPVGLWVREPGLGLFSWSQQTSWMLCVCVRVSVSVYVCVRVDVRVCEYVHVCTSVCRSGRHLCTTMCVSVHPVTQS